jgi:hypothetical protein
VTTLYTAEAIKQLPVKEKTMQVTGINTLYPPSHSFRARNTRFSGEAEAIINNEEVSEEPVQEKGKSKLMTLGIIGAIGVAGLFLLKKFLGRKQSDAPAFIGGGRKDPRQVQYLEKQFYYTLPYLIRRFEQLKRQYQEGSSAARAIAGKIALLREAQEIVKERLSAAYQMA